MRLLTMGHTTGGGRGGAPRLRRFDPMGWSATERLLLFAGLRPGMRVLDVGCGSGETTLRIAALVGPGGQAVGIDRDAELLEDAQRRAEEHGIPAAFWQKEVADLAEEDERFDLVFASRVSSRFERPVEMAAALVEVMGPRGRLAIEEARLHEPGLDEAATRSTGYYGMTARAIEDPTAGMRLPDVVLGVLANAGVGGVRVLDAGPRIQLWGRKDAA